MRSVCICDVNAMATAASSAGCRERDRARVEGAVPRERGARGRGGVCGRARGGDRRERLAAATNTLLQPADHARAARRALQALSASSGRCIRARGSFPPPPPPPPGRIFPYARGIFPPENSRRVRKIPDGFSAPPPPPPAGFFRTPAEFFRRKIPGESGKFQESDDYILNDGLISSMTLESLTLPAFSAPPPAGFFCRPLNFPREFSAPGGGIFPRRYRSRPTTATSGSVGCAMSRIAPTEPLSRPNGFPARRSTHVAPPPRVPAKRPSAGPARRHRGDHARARLQVHDRALIGSRVVQTQAFLPRAHEDGPPVAGTLIVVAAFSAAERQRGDPGGGGAVPEPIRGGGFALNATFWLSASCTLRSKPWPRPPIARSAPPRVARATSAGHGPPPGSAGSTSASSNRFLSVAPPTARHRIAGAHGSTTRGVPKAAAASPFASSQGAVKTATSPTAVATTRRASARAAPGPYAWTPTGRAPSATAPPPATRSPPRCRPGEREPSRGRARPGGPERAVGRVGVIPGAAPNDPPRAAGLAPATGRGQGVQARAPRRLRGADDPELVRRTAARARARPPTSRRARRAAAETSARPRVGGEGRRGARDRARGTRHGWGSAKGTRESGAAAACKFSRRDRTTRCTRAGRSQLSEDTALTSAPARRIDTTRPSTCFWFNTF